MPAQRKTNQSKRLTGAGLIAVTAATILMMAWAIFPTPAVATHVTPQLVEGNPTCGGDKFDPPNNGTHNVPGFGSITVSNANGSTFNWSSTFGIDSVIVKGGPNAHVYTYDPPTESLGDTGLHAPVNPNNGQFFGLSHIEFCFDKDEAPNLDITKTASPTQVSEGGAFSYTITVQNTGDASATNVVVTDDLDNNLTGVSVSASQGTCDPVGAGNTIECDLGTLAAGGSATVTINATAPQLPLTQGGPCEISIANTASVDSDQTDKVSDEAPLVTVTGTGCDEAPNLDITKTASPTQVSEGGAFSYTITVQNTGDASATNVVVTDDLDNNLTGVSVSASQGTCDPVGAGNTIECDLGTLAAGGSATVTINATAPQLPLTQGGPCEISIANTASVDSDQTDKVSDEAPLVTVTGSGCGGGGGGGGPTTPTPTTIAPTTVTPAPPPPDDDTTPPETSVQPTTVTPPSGTAFTGPENVIPLGVIALTLMTTGSGLLWAGSRLSRREDDEN